MNLRCYLSCNYHTPNYLNKDRFWNKINSIDKGNGKDSASQKFTLKKINNNINEINFNICNLTTRIYLESPALHNTAN